MKTWCIVMIHSFALLVIGSDGCLCGNSRVTVISTAQTLAPNDVKNTRWQRPYPGYFGFTFVQWEEMETFHPSYIQSMEKQHVEAGETCCYATLRHISTVTRCARVSL